MAEKAPLVTSKAVTKPKPFDILIKGQNKCNAPQTLLTGVGQAQWTEEHLSLQEIIVVSPKSTASRLCTIDILPAS
jgi:hypothetical protein